MLRDSRIDSVAMEVFIRTSQRLNLYGDSKVSRLRSPRTDVPWKRKKSQKFEGLKYNM